MLIVDVTISQKATMSAKKSLAELQATYDECFKKMKFHRHEMDKAQATLTAYEACFVERVIALADTQTDEVQAEWKRVIMEEDLVDNVVSILDLSCHNICDLKHYGKNVAALGVERLGEYQSLKWKEFAFEVIQYLWTQGAFGTYESGFNNFENAWDRCEELTEGAAVYLLEHPDWTPKKA